MPRGDNPNSRANLKPLSTEEARKRGRKGGKATAAMHKRLKTFQEIDAEHTTDEERVAMLDALKAEAISGNPKAFDLYGVYMGMKPADKVAVSTFDEDAVSGLKSAIALRKNEPAE